jgi:hypothetical protein
MPFAIKSHSACPTAFLSWPQKKAIFFCHRARMPGKLEYRSRKAMRQNLSLRVAKIYHVDLAPAQIEPGTLESWLAPRPLDAASQK